MSFLFEDPLVWIEEELKKATARAVPEANAMQIATRSRGGALGIRTVLFKGLVRGGLSFYTNYSSSKAQDLAVHEHAAANFFWPTLAQQIRVQGVVHKLTREESEKYFKTRPRLSQLGAWASLQSKEIPNIEWLENRVAEYEKKFAGQDVPCPMDWGGYHLIPNEIEFWLGQEGRLHRRYVFERLGAVSEWRKYMKSP